jgi:hypothetical protein
VADVVRALDFFPPVPKGLRGRAGELATLTRMVDDGVARLALVGGGGSGKSMLAAALGHHVRDRFAGRIHWFRIGAWDSQTLLEMFALRFGTARARDVRLGALRTFFRESGPRLIVLDNHEDDRATAKLLDALADVNVIFLITARRCLLSGVLIYPVTAPLVTSGRAAFRRVASLTRLLRFNPLALDIADGIVRARGATVAELSAFLHERGVDRVRVIAHEDDLPEVSLLVDWAWERLREPSRRVLAVLAHVEGDHTDEASLAALARVRYVQRALEPLVAYRLVQEPLRARFALHAVVRYAIARRTSPEPQRLFEHYLSLLEQRPERLRLEQTHLFTAMDHAHRQNDMDGLLRIERLLAQRYRD